jgi:8-oxo-dGTP pyrophosphatase MutT (NUDIX family)
MAKYVTRYEVVDWSHDENGTAKVVVWPPSWYPFHDDPAEALRYDLRSVAAQMIVHFEGQPHLLLAEQADQPGRPWGPPAGMVEPRETPEGAVIREVREETGIFIRQPTLAFLRVRRSSHPGCCHMIFRCTFDGPPLGNVCGREGGVTYLTPPTSGPEIGRLLLVPRQVALGPGNSAYHNLYHPRTTLPLILDFGGWQPPSDPGLDWPYG